MTREKQSYSTPEVSVRLNGPEEQAKQHPLERLMRKLGIPVTPESFAELTSMGDKSHPREFSAEEALSIPEHLRKA